MIKKYVMIIAMLLAILMFTSTSTASFLFPNGERYERLPENSLFKAMLDRLYQVAYDNDDDVALDADEEDDETGNEEDDGEYDDGMTDLDDNPEENVLLSKTGDIVGEITPDNGDEPVDEVDDLEGTSNTIDHPDGDVNATNGLTIDEGVWTVKLERFVEIVMVHNENLGAALQRVVERIFAPGTTAESGGTAENDVVGVVVEGGSVGTPGEDIADVVVLTDDD